MSSESEDKSSDSEYEPESSENESTESPDELSLPGTRNMSGALHHITADTRSDGDLPDPVFLERRQNLKRKIFELKEKTSKKRHKNENEWKRKKSAIGREKGEEYLSQKGKLIPRKKINEEMLCKEKCRLKCTNKFNLEAREAILKKYYSLDVNSKNALLFNSISIRPVKRHLTTIMKRQKKFSFTYSITYNQKTEIICRDALCSLYQFNRKKIEIIQRKLKKGECAPTPDKRGQHTNRPHKIPEDVVDAITNHIQQFPADESHYSRNKNCHKKYLSPLLNVCQMHKLYIEDCKSKNLEDKFVVKLSSYNKIFCTKFNLSFGTPRSDTCSICDSGQNTEEHTESFKMAFEMQKLDRQKPVLNKKTCYITMDLQQTMPLPKLSTNKAFYLRQMWYYNFGVHCVTSSESVPYFFNWTEDMANKGSVEIASCLYRFCHLLKDQNEDITHLIIWSDSCAGQNKNFNIICLYQLLVLNGTFDIIEHKFPEVGHSYLDSDRDFGRIEKKIRKHENIYVPEQYSNIIKSASTKNAMTINMENYFYNFDELPLKLRLVNRKTNMLKEKLNFRDNVKWIKVDEFGSFWYKNNLDEFSPFHKVELFKTGVKTLTRADEIKLHRFSEKRGGLTSEKQNNLRAQLQYIKDEYKWYYEKILEENETNPKVKKTSRRTV